MQSEFTVKTYNMYVDVLLHDTACLNQNDKLSFILQYQQSSLASRNQGPRHVSHYCEM